MKLVRHHFSPLVSLAALTLSWVVGHAQPPRPVQPVPDTLEGARIVGTKEAEALWREKKAVFFDVMPNTPKPAGT